MNTEQEKTFTACTIVAKNYVALARTLARSFKEQHPELEFYALIVDETEGYLSPDEEPFTLVRVSDLGIADVRSMAFKYDITEFSTAVKPFFLEYLFAQQEADCLLYLDPDILVTASLVPLVGELSDADIILTPHLDSDYPDDGLMPNDSHIMRSGIFNLGFLGLKRGDNSLAFLRWWQRKLHDRCYVDPWAGYMVDQKFIDYAYVLFDNIKLVRDPGYNVAYWNFHSRMLEESDKGWLCNGQALRFFHFSNYKPENAETFSGHQTRFGWEQRPDLAAIFRHYREKLLENGYEESSAWPYSWGFFSNGRKVGAHHRVAYKDGLERWEFDDPFEYSNLPTFLRLKAQYLRFLGLFKAVLRKVVPSF